MPAHLDAPAPGISFDPAGFHVRGWMSLDPAQHAELAAAELWSGNLLLGETSAFHERPDVNAMYALPPERRCGFEFLARHPTLAPGAPLEVDLIARFRSGERSAPLFSTRVAPLSADRNPRDTLLAHLPATARGLEIGAHARPVEGLSPFYADSVAHFAGTAGRANFLADALALPLPDATLDYLCSSHVLEHLPDPIAALHEWHRVLCPGGWLYLVVPDKRFTFDAPRPVTTCAHLLRDFFDAATAATSIQHVDEFIFQSDWPRLWTGTTAVEQPLQQAAAREHYLCEINAGRPVDIHFHTFTPESLATLLRSAGFVAGVFPRFKLIARAERYPPERTDGIGLLLRKPNRGGTAKPPVTFTLAHRDCAVAPLPLVCPVSLAPLSCEASASGERTLIAHGSTHRYSFQGDLPVLLPATGAKPLRAWSRQSSRILPYALSRVRLAARALANCGPV